MLIGVPPILSPEILKALCEMGHGDRLVIADGNFPVNTVGKDALVLRLDGHGVPEILDAVLKMIPLDTFVAEPARLMEKNEGDETPTPIWETYKEIVAEHEARGVKAVGFYGHDEFIEEARKAYLIIATSETAIYANVMLQKGVVIPA